MTKLSTGSSKEFIENNIVACFRQAHLIQFILGSIRVVIKDGVVELPSKWHDLYSSIVALLTFCASSYYELFYYHTMFSHGHSIIMFCACTTGVTAEFTSYITSLYVSRFETADLNVRIYYMLQKIDIILKLTRETYYTEVQARVMNKRMILLCFLFPIGYGCHSWSLADHPIYTLFLVVGLLAIYTDLLLFDAMLYFLAVRLSIFNKMLKNHVQKYEAEEPKEKTAVQKLLLRVIPDFDRVDTTLEWEQWSECIQTVLESYRMLNKIFSYPVMISVIVLVLWTLIAIAGMVLGRQSGLYPPLATAMIGVWASYSGLILWAHAILADWISYEFKECKKLCVGIMYLCDDPYRKEAGKVLRNIHYSDPKFIMYGVIELNRNLPMTVVEIIATNVLVVIQFFTSR